MNNSILMVLIIPKGMGAHVNDSTIMESVLTIPFGGRRGGGLEGQGF